MLLPSAPLLVLAPHPDDEILGCARLMQQAATAGCPLIIVWLTDGSASHGPLTHEERNALVFRRYSEADEGLSALGISPLATYRLGHPDGELEKHAQEARLEVERFCQRHNVSTVAVTDAGDSHPDHRAAHALAIGLKDIPDLITYPVSARFDGDDYAPPVGTMRLATWPGDAKRSALLQHRSQMEAAAVCPMTMTTIERFCADPEYFMPETRRAL